MHTNKQREMMDGGRIKTVVGFMFLGWRGRRGRRGDVQVRVELGRGAGADGPGRARAGRAHGTSSGQTSDGSFSAVSTATIASKDAFFCIFRDLQDLHSFAPLESQVEKNTMKTTWKIPTNKPLRSRARANNTAPANKQVTQRRPMEGVASEAK